MTPRNLWEDWPALRQRIRSAAHLICCVDFDGTLVPIAAHPSDVVVPVKVRRLLRRLADHPRASVIVSSGRSLRDLRRRIGLGRLVYIGNHGCELTGPSVRYQHPLAHRSRPILKRLARQLSAAVQPFPRAWVEDKGLTLGVHERGVPPGHRRLLARQVRLIVRPYQRMRKVRVARGRMVWDIRPNIQWHKGRALRWWLRDANTVEPHVLLGLGDDRTDEDTFRAVNALRGISVLVGRAPERTAARYWLRGPAAVSTLLRRVREALAP